MFELNRPRSSPVSPCPICNGARNIHGARALEAQARSGNLRSHGFEDVARWRLNRPGRKEDMVLRRLTIA